MRGNLSRRCAIAMRDMKLPRDLLLRVNSRIPIFAQVARKSCELVRVSRVGQREHVR
jgi:hypothetical protein